jgi:hypothetical protein
MAFSTRSPERSFATPDWSNKANANGTRQLLSVVNVVDVLPEAKKFLLARADQALADQELVVLRVLV